MSQATLDIANQSRTNFRIAVNAALQALASQNSGSTAPSELYPFMPWADTSSNKLKMRDSSNASWIEVGDLDEENLGLLPKAGGAMAGVLQLDKSTDIVAAATTDLGTATGNSVTVTHASGTLAITSFGAATDLQAGTVIDVTLSISGGTLTLTHNATSLYIPGGLNLTLADKDVLRLQKTSDSNAYWKVVGGVKADGTPLVSTSASIIGSSKNLVITNNSATPNSQVDIDADEIILKNASGIAYLASSVNLTANIAASGANGLDTGAEANSINYYLYAIYNPSTLAVASLISASANSPTLPSGYTYKALVGWVYNDSSGNFIKVRWVGRKVFVTSAVITTTLPTLSYVSVSTVGVLPPQAKITTINCLVYNSSSNSTRLWVAPANSDDLAYSGVHTSGSGSASGSQHNIDAVTVTENTLYYKRTGDAAATFEMRCTGGEW
jgi:hypothetical protein